MDPYDDEPDIDDYDDLDQYDKDYDQWMEDNDINMSFVGTPYDDSGK